MIHNEVLDCIRGRRSIRNFQERQIEAEHLAAMLEAAAWAPSGSNSQSWLFTAIQNKAILAKINELVREGLRNWIPDDDYPAKRSAKAKAQKKDYNFFFNAPALIITSNRADYSNAIADCALALENLFLAGHSLGVGSCYVNYLHWLRNDLPLRNYLYELGIPKEHTICGSAAVGYISKPSIAPPRKEGTINIIN